MKKNKNEKNSIKKIIKEGNGKVALSFAFMGLGQLAYKQIGKGLIFVTIEILFIVYLILNGASSIIGFFTLGTMASNPWYGIVGDNSIVMLIMGVVSIIVVFLFFVVYFFNIKDIYNTQLSIENNTKPNSFMTEMRKLLDDKFYILVLILPIIGVCIFSIMPIVFMILVAFTNYGGDIVPPALVDWVGIDNFIKIVTLVQFKSTFLQILGWNILWAILATIINYFGGLALALLLNKKCVKGKVFWRAFPILAYAIPGFITLLAFKFMFSYGGPINYYIELLGNSPIGFLDLDAKWSARIIGLLVNAWITIPSSMLLASGILSNMNTDLYEAAEIDGASSWVQFKKLTLPFVVFATTPVLISQFIGNFNNFGIFYFLRGGLYIDGYFLASDTDLLINWLYNLSIDNNYYSIGASISLIIFIITSIISLIVYIASPAYKQEDTYR